MKPYSIEYGKLRAPAPVPERMGGFNEAVLNRVRKAELQERERHLRRASMKPYSIEYGKYADHG